MTSRTTPTLPSSSAHLSQHLWWGDAMGQSASRTWPSGHAALDALLPGGGWPSQDLIEVLQPLHVQAEWRLVAPAVAALVARGGSVLLIGPRQCPHLPGLAQWGVPADRVVWVHAATEAQRLWATEQALKSDALTAVMSWLPQARPEQLRRLQTLAAAHAGLSFLFRPMAQAQVASPAPLRLALSLGQQPDEWQVQVLKRRGSWLPQPVALRVPVAWRRLWAPWQAPTVVLPVQPATHSFATSPALPEVSHGLLDRSVAS